MKEENGYILFAYSDYYPYGGIEDMRGCYGSIDEAKKAFNELVIGAGEEDGPLNRPCGQIVDRSSLKLLLASYQQGEGVDDFEWLPPDDVDVEVGNEQE